MKSMSIPLHSMHMHMYVLRTSYVGTSHPDARGKMGEKI